MAKEITTTVSDKTLDTLLRIAPQEDEIGILLGRLLAQPEVRIAMARLVWEDQFCCGWTTPEAWLSGFLKPSNQKKLSMEDQLLFKAKSPKTVEYWDRLAVWANSDREQTEEAERRADEKAGHHRR